MLRVAVLDDHPDLVDSLGSPLIRARHRVHTQVAPVDFEEIMAFAPQVIVVGVSRKPESVGRIGVLEPDDIYGYKAISGMQAYPAIALVPILVVGVGLFEPEFPWRLNYDLFLTFPDEMKLYADKVAELAALRKTRRRISGYVCPAPGCGSRLAYVKEPIRDLSCPKCGVGVALIDDTHGTWLDVHGGSHPCLLTDLRAPAGRS